MVVEASRSLLYALNSAEWSRLLVALPARERTRIRRRIKSGDLAERDVVTLVALLLSRADTAPWCKILREALRGLSRFNCRYRHDLSLAQNLALPVAMIHMPGIVRSSQLKLSPRVRAALESCLSARLAFTARFAVQRSWQMFCAAAAVGRFDATATDRGLLAVYFQDGVTPRTLSLLYRHPGLGRLWAVQLLLWSEFAREFFRRFRRFIRRTHTREGTERRKIAMINFDRSDWHRGNRTVVHVVLNNDSEWYYKPRPGYAEAFLYSSLRFVSRLVGIPFETPRLLLWKDYFWMESVSQKPCRDTAEAAMFYVKAGILLYLLCRLRGVDFHAGNLIARQTDPVLIDCETLFHPRMRGMPQRAFRATGFFPLKDHNRAGRDGLSALGRRSAGEHAPMCRDRRVFVSNFATELLQGFSLLAQPRYRHPFDRWLMKNLASMPTPTTRRIFRSTQEYVHILGQSLQSEVLKTGSARLSFLQAACAGQRGSARTRAEVKMLEQADIPVFEDRAACVRRFTVTQIQQEMLDLRLACEHLGAD